MTIGGLMLIIVAGVVWSGQTAHHTPLKVLKSVQPQYSQEALDEKLEGNVVLHGIVGIDGALSEIKVVRGLGKGLNEKAIECVRQWKFSPATRHGDPVVQYVTIEINFRLPPGIAN